jgi:hypothetical protein
MKNKIKLLGVIALIAVIGFSMTACEEAKDPVILSWTQGSLTGANAEAWHTFNVSSGTTYYCWVKEYWSNSVVVADGYADVRLDARYGSQTGDVIFQNSDMGANSSTVSSSGGVNSSFQATQSGVVHLRVYKDSLVTRDGLYKVAVTTNNKRPSGE